MSVEPPTYGDGRDDNATHGMTARRIRRAGLWAPVGAVLSAVVASACCWLPLTLLAFGVSAAGVSAAVEPFRPVLLVLCAVFLGTGFYLAYFRKDPCSAGGGCAAPDPRPKRFNRVVLWMATVAAVTFALFPGYAGPLLTDAPQVHTDGTLDRHVVSLRIEGMTCEGCALSLTKTLTRVPGVEEAFVSFEQKEAKVRLDPAAPPSTMRLLEAVRHVGFTAAVQ